MASPPAAPPIHQPQWLDKLPTDVCERLVLHVSGGKPTEEALGLTRISPRLRSAVIAVISPRLQMPMRVEDQQTETFRDPWEKRWILDSDYAGAWLSIFKDHVVEFTTRTKYSKRLTIIEDLLKSPSLKRLCIFDKRTLFGAMEHSQTIREVDISLRSMKYGQRFFEALSRMNLEKLSTACICCDTPKSCPFQDDSLFNSGYNALAVSCPNLKSLSMWCTVNIGDNERDGSTAPVWRIFPELPSLKQLSFNGEAPEEAIPNLRNLEGVGINWAGAGYQLAMSIGTPVMELGTDALFDDEMIRGLAGCPRLKKISLEVKTGAEVALADTFRELANLQDVWLQWENRPECDHGAFDHHNCYVEAIPGAVLSAIQAAPNLTAIKLMYARLSVQELQSILNFVGERLRKFTVSIDDQDEPPFERLMTILCSAAKSNPGLCNFDVSDLQSVQLHAEGQVPRLNVAMQRLQRVAPLLDTMELRRFITEHVV